MPEELKVYALDEGKNNFQTMTKEQILSAINQKISSGSIVNIDDAFITKIKEMNAGALVQLWIGTQAEFQALSEKQEDVLYILSDDPTVDDIEDSISSLEQSVSDVAQNNTYLNGRYNQILNGQQTVYRAKYASSDTSKGTIDERLDALGFKEGVITETENFTITDYTLYRRSKIVTFKIKGYPTHIRNSDHSFLKESSIKIPYGFRPKENIIFHGKATGKTEQDALYDEGDRDGTEGNRICIGTAEYNPSTFQFKIRFVFNPEGFRNDTPNWTYKYGRGPVPCTFESETIGWEVADDE